MNLSKFTSKDKFLMLALDHRSSIKSLINPQNPETVPAAEIINLKEKIISSLDSQFSSLLLDVEYGLPAYKNRQKPFLLAIEKSEVKEIDGEKITELEHSVEELKKLGASGIKLLLYFNPESELAKQQLKIAKQVEDDCEREDLPFFLEIVTQGGEPKQKSVIASLKQFLEGEIYPEVFKLEYPGDAASCKQITGILGNAPWILLTAGEDFELFKNQLQIAVQNGCSGFLAGRALWKEFKLEILQERFKEISQIALNKL